MHIDAVARNLIAHQRELHRLLHAFARNADVYRRSLRSLQQVGHVRRAHIFGRFPVDRDDHVARMNAGLVGGRSGKRKNHDHFIIARTNGHTHAVIFAALVFAHQRVRLGIEEIRVRIERVQHARNRPVVDGLIRVHRFGVVVLNQRIDVGELLQAVLNVRVAREDDDCWPERWAKQNPQKAAGKQRKKLPGRVIGENYVPF